MKNKFMFLSVIITIAMSVNFVALGSEGASFPLKSLPGAKIEVNGE